MSEQAEKLLRWGLRVPGRLNFNGYLDFERPACLLSDCGAVDVSIGAFSYAARRTNINRSDIGRYCSIGEDCHIGLGQHPIYHLTSSSILYDENFWAWAGAGKPLIQHDDKYQRVSIGNDVWVGTGALINGGVKIGNGAVIAAGSVVTKDVEPYSIVGGVPARIIRQRFSDKIIERIGAISWWRYDLLTWFKCPSHSVSSKFDDNFLDRLQSAIDSRELPLLNPPWVRLKSEKGVITIGAKPDL